VIHTCGKKTEGAPKVSHDGAGCRCGHFRTMAVSVVATVVALPAAVGLADCGIVSGPATGSAHAARRTTTAGPAPTTSAPPTTPVSPTTTSTTTLLPGLYSPQPRSLLQFVSASTGWFASGSTILLTTDGGSSWRTSFSGTASGLDDSIGTVLSIAFVNDLDGWALLDGLGLMATRNGGNTWSAPAEPPPGPIVMFTFVGPVEGWAITDEGALLRSVDGGLSWLTEPTPVPIVTICATPARRWFGAASGDIYTSLGSGPWSLSLSGATVGPPFHNSVGPSPTPPTPWLACAGADAWALYQYGEAAGSDPFVTERTLNSGGNWTEIASINGGQPVATPTGIGMTGPPGSSNSTRAWILGYCGPCGAGTASLITTGTASMATTSDGSSSFASAALPGAADSSVSPLAASFPNPALGWAVTSEIPVRTAGLSNEPTDALLRSDDGGATWMLVNADIGT
jgi:hypothetical protein